MAGAQACPGCLGPFEQVNLKGALVDHCLKCQGYWFDAGELTLSVEVLRPLTGFEGAKATAMTCPRCGRGSLVELRFPGTEQIIDACPGCRGTYLP
jgi:Zn-finger nucleic acid-binding protein